jgi:anti-anti-sigma factor
LVPPFEIRKFDKPGLPEHYVGGPAGSIAQRQKNVVDSILTMELELNIAPQEDATVVRCRGRLIYGQESAEFIRALRQLIDSTKHVVLQMADVTYVDSGGVGALGATYVAAHNRETEIKLAALSARVAEVLRITGLDLLFDIHSSESEAVEAFSKSSDEPSPDLGVRTS